MRLRCAPLLVCFCASVGAADDPARKEDPRELMKELGKAKRLDRDGQVLLYDRTVAEYEITQLSADANKLVADKKVKKAVDLLEDPARLAELQQILNKPPAQRAGPYAEFLKQHDLTNGALEAANAVLGLQARADDFRKALRAIEKQLSDHEKTAVVEPARRLPVVSSPRGVPDADAVLRRYNGAPGDGPEVKPKGPDAAAVPDLDNIRRKPLPRKEP